jgi:uncharacterized protein (TIGR02996 family)
MTATDTTESGLLRAILAAPDDDLPRLVLADCLDENATASVPCDRCQTGGVCNGKIYTGMDGMKWITCPKCNGRCHTGNGRAERAEFIRVQVELAKWTYPLQTNAPLIARERELLERWNRTWFHPVREWVTMYEVRRGFVDAVHCTLQHFVGDVCGCTMIGGEQWHDPLPDCPDCSGTGRTEVLARRLFDRHPVTKVVLTDREPVPNQYGGQLVAWTFGDPAHRTSDVPYSLIHWMHRLRGEEPEGQSWIHFPTRELALSALSAACVQYGRALAGIGPPAG